AIQHGDLHVSIHDVRPMEADQSGVEIDVGVLTSGPRVSPVAQSTELTVAKVQSSSRMNALSSQSFQPVLPNHTTWDDSP
ncbi:hypothetical protein, partial [Mesorhizobium sp. M4B.F.Ca.ET.049.02.1.2]|uniref:hypothetical protein n=1 Tax=Mesorhizobium sp. M4B.F.Ca.ET.049.02.1.2 TaxID=2496752 RepID=UPI001AECDD35